MIALIIKLVASTGKKDNMQHLRRIYFGVAFAAMQPCAFRTASVFGGIEREAGYCAGDIDRRERVAFAGAF